MVVLTIIGVIVGLIFLAYFIGASNKYSKKVYKYEIFNMGTFIISAIGFLAIYFGNSWYTTALKKHGDILNGELMIVIGTLLLLGVLYVNIKNTSFMYGLIMSVVAGIIYAAATPLIFFAFLLATAFFSETKPVYRIND